MVISSVLPQMAEFVVDRIVMGGMGLTELNGLRVFIPYAAPGEVVRAKIVTRKRDYAVAQIEEILTPSPFRVLPRCPYYESCGGCNLQHISYDGQLAVKKMLVDDTIQHVARLSIPVLDISFKSNEWHYRNKTQYPVSGNNTSWKIGFYEQGTHNLIDISRCFLHPEEFDQIREIAREALIAAGETPYQEILHRGNVRHLVLRRGTDGKTVVTIVTMKEKLNPKVTEKIKKYPGVAGIIQNINPQKTNRILGEKNLTLWGQNFVRFSLLNKEFRVSANSFFQVNLSQAEELCRRVIKAIAPQGDEVVLDLFSGVGTLSLLVADKVKKVIGVELESTAIADANFNAQNLGIKNAFFLAGDVNSVIANIQQADAVIIDPPRKGCSMETLKRVVSLNPRVLVYVSCNPAAFARDLALLRNMGYGCDLVEPLDMFPQTTHVELVAKFTPAGKF